MSSPRAVERFGGDHLLLSPLEDAIQAERVRTVADLDPGTIRDRIGQVELTYQRWEVIGYERGDVLELLDRHFRPEQDRWQAERAREQQLADARIAGQARVDWQTAIYQENAARRTWGLPELEAEPDDVPASA